MTEEDKRDTGATEHIKAKRVVIIAERGNPLEPFDYELSKGGYFSQTKIIKE